MIRSIITIVITLVLFGCANEPKVEKDPTLIDTSLLTDTTTIEFDKISYDFGEIQAGEKVKVNFNFTNTGSNELLIAEAFGSCGCTVPKYPEAPISPGGKSSIEVAFNSAGREGKQIKKVYIISNTSPRKNVLEIKANVIAQN